MGITERKEREREEMRHLILNAAQKLFLENGYEKTSIRGIADVIEYSPATIYLYYKDKNELLLALHVVAFQKMMQEFSEVAVVENSFERLVSLGKQYIKFAIENPGLYDLMFIMQAPIEALACKDEVWEDGMKSFDFLRIIVTECKNKGHFRENLDVDTVCLTIWSYMHGLITIYLKNRMDMFEDDRQMDRMQESFQLFIEMLKVSFK
ncbi:TetR/AcrR family transcriptional regulator [Dyadobacter psychrotolerans]|uniref:TetR/AcrR family transcriptional regulator n=1 Tax=Dyadobacter psychrotolerans TaxID=2541721 RepID=A0A4R5DDR4_9BACT|nr:TetR/AcrR family transcriptional regulator [Dyadobacter psychrotolerans]TDE11966.1 TetR/AcrR family transcriptional regulator [Dyadobacter psychrotolerans]